MNEDDPKDDREKALIDGFRARLKEIRGNRTREVMGELLGISAERYAKWEDRGTQPDFWILPKLWKIGDVTPEWLLEGKEMPKKAQKPSKAPKARSQ